MEKVLSARMPKKRPKHLVSTFIAYLFIMLLFFHTKDFIASIVKDQYSYVSPRIESLYMLIIGFAILMIGKVFDRGVSLQEENDLIA